MVIINNIYAGSEVYSLRITHKEMLTKLDPNHFAKINRGTIININHAIAYEKKDSSSGYVELTNGNVELVSKKYLESIPDSLRFEVV